MLLNSHLLHLKFTQGDQTCSAAGCTPPSMAAGQSSKAPTLKQTSLPLPESTQSSFSVLFPRIFKKMRFLQSPVLQQLERKYTAILSWREQNEKSCWSCSSKAGHVYGRMGESCSLLQTLPAGTRCVCTAGEHQTRDTNIPLPSRCLNFANAALVGLILLFWVDTPQPGELLQLSAVQSGSRHNQCLVLFHP